MSDRKLLLNEMPDEELDTRKLAMFPLLLQAVYNCHKALKEYRFGKQGSLDDGEPYRSEFDAEYVLRLLGGVGIRPVYSAEVTAGGTVRLHHFYDQDNEKILKMYDPSKRERDSEILRLEHLLDAANKELVSCKQAERNRKARDRAASWFLANRKTLEGNLSAVKEKTEELQSRLSVLLTQAKSLKDARTEVEELKKIANGIIRGVGDSSVPKFDSEEIDQERPVRQALAESPQRDEKKSRQCGKPKERGEDTKDLENIITVAKTLKEGENISPARMQRKFSWSFSYSTKILDILEELGFVRQVDDTGVYSISASQAQLKDFVRNGINDISA